MLVGAGEDGHAAVLFDAHGHFRADQVETFGTDMTAQQAQAGDAHLGFRRARHHRAFGVAHHDVADAHRGAAALGMFDLGAADLDVMTVAEILLDGRASHGVTTSSWMGPLASRHHRPAAPSVTSAASAAMTMPPRRMSRWCRAKKPQ